MTGLSSLLGRLHLQPGRVPALSGGRPEATRLAIGTPAQELPTRLATLYTLCAHAHRFTASLALDAAVGRAFDAGADELQALRLATARDQVMRMAIEWPLRLGIAAQGNRFEPSLRDCPLWRSRGSHAAALAALPGWLARHWLGQAPEVWLAALDADPARAVAIWCERAGGPLAALLRKVQRAALAIEASGPPWLPLDDPLANLPALAARLAHRDEPVAAGSVVPDTGPWTRSRDPLRAPVGDAWMRMVSRLVDLVRLAAPGGEQWLAHGALNTGTGQGLAWTEMARGLLVHWVALDCSGARVADLRVLAPTDLNFHPQGILARALATMPARGSADAARLLAVAFDPCVEFDVVDDAPEAAHA